jgi:DNA-binding NarL/FixJ family response regulator
VPDTNVIRLVPSLDFSIRCVAELTPRELGVLKLIAEGMSNTAIGEHLVLGVRTIESHVATIFMKLGLHADDCQHNRRVRAVLAYQAAMQRSAAVA